MVFIGIVMIILMLLVVAVIFTPWWCIGAVALWILWKHRDDIRYKLNRWWKS